MPAPVTVSCEQIRSERARTLRRMGRYDEAVATWETIARGGRTDAARAWIEVAKLREHLLRDPSGALVATESAARILDWLRSLDAPEPALEVALAARRRRLARRIRRSASVPRRGRAARGPAARSMLPAKVSGAGPV
jgi:hypothetical protein